MKLHTRLGSPRRTLVFGLFVTGAAMVLLLSSAAFACTVFKGTLTVKANATNTTVTGVAEGLGAGMVHCGNTTTGSADVDDANPNATVTIATASGTCASGGTSKLDSGTYVVAWAPEWAMDCMLVGGVGVQLGTINVDGSGNTTGTDASRTFTIPARATSTGGVPNDKARICVSSTTQSGVQQGNAVPVLVI